MLLSAQLKERFATTTCPRCLGLGRHGQTRSGYTKCFSCQGRKKVLSKEDEARYQAFIAAHSVEAKNLAEGWWLLPPPGTHWQQVFFTRQTVGDLLVHFSDGRQQFYHPNKRVFTLEAPARLPELISTFLEAK